MAGLPQPVGAQGARARARRACGKPCVLSRFSARQKPMANARAMLRVQPSRAAESGLACANLPAPARDPPRLTMTKRLTTKACGAAAGGKAKANGKGIRVQREAKPEQTVYKRLPARARNILRALAFHRAPVMLFRIVLMILLQQGSDAAPENLHFFETFAGKREVTKAYRKAKKSALPFEIEDDAKLYDFIGACGFANVIYTVLRLECGGGFLSAPVCSTWALTSDGAANALRCLVCARARGRLSLSYGALACNAARQARRSDGQSGSQAHSRQRGPGLDQQGDVSEVCLVSAGEREAAVGGRC